MLTATIMPHRSLHLHLVLFFLALAISACKRQDPTSSAKLPNWGEICEKIGLCDAPPPPAENLIVLCDYTEGSSCNREHLSITLDIALARASVRPGTRVAVQGLGVSGGATAFLAEQVSPTSTAKGERAQKKQAERWRAQAKEFLLLGAGALYQEPQARRSPIAESIAKIALTSATSKLPRHLIIVSDLREVSAYGGNFECGVLPSEASWLSRLERHELLLPESLSGTRVSFSFVAASGPSRCPMSLEREMKIRALWGAALKRAGAEVFFATGPVEFTEALASKE